MLAGNGIRVERGELTAEELAALTVVLLAVTRPAESAEQADAVGRQAARWRERRSPSPRSWRSSGAAA